jgi:ferric-dicitrate binding protein FerR (iron transport regulator)
MSCDQNIELAEFNQFLSHTLAAGDATISPEEALDQWRAAHPSPEAIAQDLAAVREALQDMAEGDVGKTLEAFDRDFRRRHGLSVNS